METAKNNVSNGLLALYGGPSGEILRLLQRHGPLSAQQLRDKLGVRSLNAVREQLTGLAASELITTTSVRHGTGRPFHVYGLSAKAQALFSHGYDLLLKLLLDELFEREGYEHLQSVLTGVSERLTAYYGGHDDGQGLQHRLAALVQAYADRNTPIALAERGDVTELHTYSCPYYGVAQETAAICMIEQRMMEHVLGKKVRLQQRIVDGHTGCRFVVEHDSEPPAATGSADSAYTVFEQANK